MTEEQQQDIYPAATLENVTFNGGTAISTESQYYNIDNTKIVTQATATGIPVYQNNNGITNNNPFSNTTANSARLYQLNAATNTVPNKTGLGIALKVMAGDNLNIFGKSYHKMPADGYTLGTNLLAVADVINLFAGTNLLTGKGITGSQITSQVGFPTTVTALLNNQPAQTTTLPRASINWVILDEQFKYVSGGFDMVGTATSTEGTYKNHTLTGITIPKNGYIYVYCSNESQYNVFFDNLQIVHNRGAILEETHYYPFGLTMAGISSKAAGSLENKRKWNKGSELESKEFSDGSGLELYFTQYRSLDPQIGRFWQIDPRPDYSQSLYSSMSNNPIRFNDPLGDSILGRTNNTIADRIVNTANRKITENNTEIASNNNKIQAARDKLASGTLSTKETRAANHTITKLTTENTELASRNDNLQTGIAAIEAMRADVNHNYSFSPPSESDGSHFVTQGSGKNVIVEGSNTGLFLHESVHVLQSLNAGGLRFSSSGRLFNASGTRVGQLSNEVQSYRVQFSFDGSFIPGEIAINLSDINLESVGRHY